MIDKHTLFHILLSAKNVTDTQMWAWMVENPTKSVSDCLITLSGADVIQTIDNVEKLRKCYEQVGKVAAIKEHRNLFSSTLYDAMETVEKLAQENNWIENTTRN